jgi:hypothetical protein
MKARIILAFTALLLVSCTVTNYFKPTPTATPLPTATTIPTPTSTPDPMAEYYSLVPDIPDGFSWKLVKDMNVILLLPDGWYFSRKSCPVVNFFGDVYVQKEEIAQACISRENLEDVAKYSVGLSVLAFSGMEDPDTLALYMLQYLMGSTGGDLFMYNSDNLDAQELKSDMANIHNTTKVLKGWDYTSGDYVVHHLRVEAEYPYGDEENKEKIVQYSSLVINDTVYLIIFETPKATWEEVTDQYGIILDYVLVLGDK